MLPQVVGILFPIFAVILVGFLVARWFRPDFTPINRINIEVFTPALVFSSLVAMPLDTEQVPLILAALLAVFVPGILMFGVCKLSKLEFKVWAPPQMFRNSGNLAIPLFTYTFGEPALASAVLLFVVSNMSHVTIGLALLSKGNPLQQVTKMPMFLAAFSALAINLIGVELWVPLHEATKLIGQAAVPVMLLSLGSQMCNMRLSGLATGLFATALSLATGLVAFGLIYAFIPLPNMQMQMMVLFTMLPPAVLNYMFAERFQISPTEVASMILFSNFFSVFTLPLILWFAFSI